MSTAHVPTAFYFRGRYLVSKRNIRHWDRNSHFPLFCHQHVKIVGRHKGVVGRHRVPYDAVGRHRNFVFHIAKYYLRPASASILSNIWRPLPNHPVGNGFRANALNVVEKLTL